MEHVLDIYYNSENFRESSNYIIERFYPSPFDFFEEIAEFYRNRGAFDIGHKNYVYFDMLFEFYFLKYCINAAPLFCLTLSFML